MVEQSRSPSAILEALQGVEGAIGDFIANGPNDGIQGYVRDQYRKRCDQFANAPGWAQALANGPAGSLGRICEPWYSSQGTDGPTRQPPFTGGQCCDGTYRISYSGLTTSQEPFQSEIDITGKIIGFGERSNQPAQPTKSATVTRQLCSGQVDVIPLYAVFESQNLGFQLISITRIDGPPDDCGDPPAEFQPGPNPPADPGPTPGPEPTADPSNPTGPPLLPIPDYDDPIGGPTPITGPDPFDRGAEPTDIPGNPDASPGGGENVSDPIAVDPGPGGGGDETDFGDPPSGRSWVGCLLQFAFPDFIGAIAGSAPQNPVAPRVQGNASLVFEGGRGDAYQVRSGSMVLVRPTGALKVTGVFVNSEPGITYTVRPISIENCPTNECASEE